MIQHGETKVIGSGENVFVKYLKGTQPKVRSGLFRDEMRNEIEKFLNWFSYKMRPETQQLIRFIAIPKVRGVSATA
jgi:hypothetical protein